MRISLEEKDQHSFNTLRQIRKVVEEGYSSTVSLGKKISRRQMIKDLYEVLAPFVASARGQSGLFESTEVAAFRPAARCSRQSQAKRLIDIVTVQRQLGDTRQSFSNEDISLEEAEAFEVFMTDIDSLLQQRGLAILNLPANDQNMQKDDFLHFWLSTLLCKAALILCHVSNIASLQ
eukprot:TRINITY_DN3840_c0_g2_i15.p1 TRINITY_DN3840_c0_g2~~TRINITY_DN3840_c0_g2_i15.p1  ORF type:complete len:177 (+),score=21.91 TRINITY_DN3840_c0_g2_i15:171-701(+)